MKTKQLEELILQSLEHEMGGVKIYETAVACAVNSDACIQRQYRPVGGHGAGMRPLAGSAHALHRICSGDEVTDSGPARYMRGRRRRQSQRQECKNNHSAVPI